MVEKFVYKLFTKHHTEFIAFDIVGSKSTNFSFVVFIVRLYVYIYFLWFFSVCFCFFTLSTSFFLFCRRCCYSASSYCKDMENSHTYTYTLWCAPMFVLIIKCTIFRCRCFLLLGTVQKSKQNAINSKTAFNVLSLYSWHNFVDCLFLKCGQKSHAMHILFLSRENCVWKAATSSHSIHSMTLFLNVVYCSLYVQFFFVNAIFVYCIWMFSSLQTCLAGYFDYCEYWEFVMSIFEKNVFFFLQFLLIDKPIAKITFKIFSTRAYAYSHLTFHLMHNPTRERASEKKHIQHLLQYALHYVNRWAHRQTLLQIPNTHWIYLYSRNAYKQPTRIMCVRVTNKNQQTIVDCSLIVYNCWQCGKVVTENS